MPTNTGLSEVFFLGEITHVTEDGFCAGGQRNCVNYRFKVFLGGNYFWGIDVRSPNLAVAFLSAIVVASPVDACLATPFTDNEIAFHLSGRTIVGYSRGSGRVWREYLATDGGTLFQLNGSDVQEGRWKVDDGQICFSYGSFREWSCKVVLDVTGCRVWNGVYLVENYLAVDFDRGSQFERDQPEAWRFNYASKIIEVLPGRAPDGP